MLVILMMNLPQKHLFWLHLESQGFFQKRNRKCSEILTTLLIGVKLLDTVKPSKLTKKKTLKTAPFISLLCHQELPRFFNTHEDVVKVLFKYLLNVFNVNLNTGSCFMEFRLSEHWPWKSITNKYFYIDTLFLKRRRTTL